MAYNYVTPTQVCTHNDMVNVYRAIDKGRLDTAVKILRDRCVFVLAENGKLFKNSSQGPGVYVFTDMERASEFIAQEENGSPALYFEKVPFYPIWFRTSDGEHCDLYVNLTPVGSKEPFMRWFHDNDRWNIGAKVKDLHYTLPYGLTPVYGWDHNKKKGLRSLLGI